MSKVPKSEMKFFSRANARIWYTPPISNPGSTPGHCAVHSNIVVLKFDSKYGRTYSQAVFPCDTIIAITKSQALTPSFLALLVEQGTPPIIAKPSVGSTRSAVHSAVILWTLARVPRAELRNVTIISCTSACCAQLQQLTLIRAAPTSSALSPSSQLTGGSITAHISAFCWTPTVANFTAFPYSIPTNWVPYCLCWRVEEAAITSNIQEYIEVIYTATAEKC